MPALFPECMLRLSRGTPTRETSPQKLYSADEQHYSDYRTPQRPPGPEPVACRGAPSPTAFEVGTVAGHVVALDRLVGRLVVLRRAEAQAPHRVQDLVPPVGGIRALAG